MSDLISALIKNGLEKAKLEVINTTEGSLLIIARPGSSKPRMLVERFAYLVHQGVFAENIMIATLTEKAPKELINRVPNRLIKQGLCTFILIRSSIPKY